MDTAMNVGLQDEIIAELTMELSDDSAFNAEFLKAKVKNAIREVKMRRNYTATSYSDEQIEKDLYNYYPVIKNVALYDYNQKGAEGQSVHNESGTNRTWISREKLFSGVIAFCKVLRR